MSPFEVCVRIEALIEKGLRPHDPRSTCRDISGVRIEALIEKGLRPHDPRSTCRDISGVRIEALIEKGLRLLARDHVVPLLFSQSE